MIQFGDVSGCHSKTLTLLFRAQMLPDLLGVSKIKGMPEVTVQYLSN